ncbi:MAG: hypothetical protein ACR2HX_22270 [Pyrinomonadaceae bacterium]
MNKTGKSSGSSDRVPEGDADFKKKFGELPLNKKVATLIQLEAATMSEAMNTIIDKSIAAGENVMDKLSGRERNKK